MEQEMNSNTATDAVMNVKIHDNALLGRLNEEGKYVLPNAVIEELIHAKKYLEQKVEDTIYLSCHLTTVEKNLTIMMNYSLIGNGDKVMVNWALVEEVAIADGLVTNQLITTICSNVYDYSEDVLLRAFAEFNVYIKDEDSGEERKLYDNEKTALTDIIVKYNIAVQTMTAKKMNKLCNKTCAKQLEYLKKSKSSYAKTILAEVEKGMDVYITLKTLEEGSVDEIDDKAMLDILNNAIEKVDVTSELEEKEDIEDQEEFHKFRGELFDDFRKETRQLEEEAQSKIVRTASDETKPEILTMLSAIKEAENSEANDTVNLKDYLSLKAGQTLDEMERHTENKMAHLAEKLSGSNQGDKYQKLDVFLLDQKEKDAKQIKEKKITLNATLTALASGGKRTTEVTTMTSENNGQTTKVELDASSGHTEVQPSGQNQVKSKTNNKNVVPKETVQKEKQSTKKKTGSTTKPVSTKTAAKKEVKTEEKTSKPTITGAAVQALTSDEHTTSTTDIPKVDEEKIATPQGKKEEEKGKDDASSMSGILERLVRLKAESLSQNEVNNSLNKTKDKGEGEKEDTPNLEDEMGL